MYSKHLIIFYFHCFAGIIIRRSLLSEMNADLSSFPTTHYTAETPESTPN